MKAKFQKFRKLNFSEKLLLFELSTILILVRFFIKFFGFNITHKLLKKIPLFPIKKEYSDKYFKKICQFTKASSAYLPINTKCLEESISICFILKVRGIDSYLKIGVKKGIDQLNAHAWVEVEDNIINGSSEGDNSFSAFDHNFYHQKK